MEKILFVVAAYVAVVMAVHSVDRKTSVVAAIAVVVSLIGMSSDVPTTVSALSAVVVLAGVSYSGTKNHRACGFMFGKISC